MHKPRRAKSWVGYHLVGVVALIGVLLSPACVESELGSQQEDRPQTSLREEVETDPTPPDPIDLGSMEGMEDQGSFGSDMGSPTDSDSPDLGGPSCPPQECAFGQQRCSGTQVEQCTEDAAGCIVWGPAMDCPEGVACVDDRCPMVANCVDDDSDGYGMGCVNGPDCDDTNSMRNSGRVEICDGLDNDCNSLTDDGIAGVGDSCAAGQGACEVTGSQVCDPMTGQLVCDAMPGQGSAETCDMIDNDCDGDIDEDQVCGAPSCADDPQEPNDSLATAFLVQPNTAVVGLLCQSDVEYFEIATTPGTRYRLNLAFPHVSGDIDMVLYRDGTPVSSATSTTDHERIMFTAQAGSTYAVEVYNLSSTSTFYRFAPSDSWGCNGEDHFEPNDSPANLPMPLISGWETSATLCPGTLDWYFLGNRTAGDTILVETYFSTSFFNDRDLDLYLYADTDGDNTLEQITVADTRGNNEYLLHTVTMTDAGPYYIVVDDRYDDGNLYDILFELL